MSRLTKLLAFSIFASGGANSQEPRAEYSPDRTVIESLTDEKLKQLDLHDKTLSMAYAEVFVASFEPGEKRPAWFEAAKLDLMRRGNSAVPLLLTLFKQHPLQ
jgi:hypothetical protein